MFYDLTSDHSDFPQELAEGDPGPGPTGATLQTVGLSLEMQNQPVNKAKVSILSLLPASQQKGTREAMPATLCLLAWQGDQRFSQSLF